MIRVNKVYNVLLIGLGRIGCTYDINDYSDKLIMSHAKACSLNPSFKLVAGIDIQPENRAKFSERYLVPSYESLDKVPIELYCDLVIIASPTNTHLNLVKSVLQLPWKPKAILCEKPVSFSTHEVEIINNLSLSKGVQIFVNYIRRPLPETFKIQELINSSKIN